jgi:FkbM family methyltransferase
MDIAPLGLPNGKVCHVDSTTMRTIAKVLRWEIFTRAQYQRSGFELRATDTVIDIGANIGLFALWAAPQIPRGRLICIEPNPQALGCLAENVRDNDLHNVVIVAAAAGCENGTMELVCWPGWEALARKSDIEMPWYLTGSGIGKFARLLIEGRLLRPHRAETAESITVQQKLLSSIMDEHDVSRVNLLKMDCEGSEYEILRALDFAHWKQIDRAIIEYHDIGTDRNHLELIEILRENGFELEIIRSMQELCYSAVGMRVGKIWARKPLRN